MQRVVGWFVFYVAVLSALAAYRWHIWSFGGDTGIFAQVTLDAFGGFHDAAEQASHFAYHWSPVLALLYPFVALTRSPLALQIVQIVLIGATVFPFYALLRRYAPDALASRISLLALIYPPLMAIAFEEFHELAFFPVVAMLLVWSIDAERWLVFAACSILAISIREDVLIVFACFGAILAVAGALRRGRPGEGLLFLAPIAPRATVAAGLWLVLSSALALVLYFTVVVPSLGGWRPSHFYIYPFAAGPLALVLAFFTQPLAAFPAVLTFGRLTFLLEAFVPLLLLPLRSAWMFAALPGLLIVLLANDGWVWRMGSHYVAIFIPALLLGTAAALIGISRERLPRADRYLSIVFGLCTIVLIAFNPMHVGHFMTPPYADLTDVERAFAVLPPNAVVSTHDEWYTHYALTNPNLASSGVIPTEYAVYADDFSYPTFRANMLPWLHDKLARGEFRIIAQFGNVKVYRHT